MALKQPLAPVQTRLAVDPFAPYFTPADDLAPGGKREKPALQPASLPRQRRNAVKGSYQGIALAIP